jgi:ABC-type nitrate/sulfonate/bicarbonate transport system permease component
VSQAHEYASASLRKQRSRADEPRYAIAVGIGSVLAALAAWFIVTHFGIISSARFPAPHEVWAAFRQVAVDGYADARLHQHILQSCRLVVIGFCFAIAIGVPLGLGMGWSRSIEAFVNPIFLLVRPIPPLAWIPLAIVWAGLGDAGKILVIWFSAFVPSVINTYTGVRSIEPHLIEAAATLGAQRRHLVRHVLVPGALPHIFTGLRLSLQASWTAVVAGELVGALYGLGQILNAGAQDIYIAMILVGMVFVGLCGALMTLALGWLELRATPWRERRGA